MFEKNAVQDLEFWSRVDLKIVKKIIELLTSTLENPFSGLGKPEPLKRELKGYWSRRISDEHRLVYTVTKEEIIVIACKTHYEKLP